MAVVIARQESLSQRDDNEIQMVRGISSDRPGFPKRRRLILRYEDEEKDNRITLLKGEDTSDEVKRFQNMEICGATKWRKPKSSQSGKRTVVNKSSSVELIDLTSSQTKRKILSMKTTTKCLYGRASSRRNLLNQKKVCMVQEESEDEEEEPEDEKDEDYSPYSSSKTKSAFKRQRLTLDFEVSENKRDPKDCSNASKQENFLQRECWIDNRTCEGEKMRKHIADMKKLETRRTTDSAQTVQHLHKRRTSAKKNSEKSSDGSVRKKVSLSKFSNADVDESDEDWEVSKDNPRTPSAQTDGRKTENFECSGDRRISVQRCCVPNKKFSFGSDFLVGDMVDDEEEDVGLTIEESTVSSYSTYATLKRSSKLTSVQTEGSNNDMKKKQDDNGMVSLENSSPSSSSSSRKSGSKCDGKSMDRSANRNIKVEKKQPVKCHQCQRNDRIIVVPCTKCKEKVYCIQCIKQW